MIFETLYFVFNIFIDPLVVKLLISFMSLVAFFYSMVFYFKFFLYPFLFAYKLPFFIKKENDDFLFGCLLFGVTAILWVVIQKTGNGSLNITQFTGMFFRPDSFYEINSPISEKLVESITQKQIDFIVETISKILESHREDLSVVFEEEVDEGTKELMFKIFDISKIDATPFKNGSATEEDYYDVIEKLKGFSSIDSNIDKEDEK